MVIFDFFLMIFDNLSIKHNYFQRSLSFVSNGTSEALLETVVKNPLLSAPQAPM